MEELHELEARISQALHRIQAGMGAMNRPVAGQGPEDFARLEAALDEEQTANAQLEERIRTLKGKLERAKEEQAAEAERHREGMGRLDGELQGLQEANAELRDASEQLRRAAEEGVSDPELINRAMKAELEALTASRAAEIAEIDAILAEFRPVLEAGQEEAQ
ncbi:hypothetical protein [Pseudoroseicyclus tamaricis]|uniref:Uncharacterized protein n=1 Tax=Pseudoroseicyclus tamaricis TaxID=2705421 RepID=A0A6B2K232_9RHOB|nr:hypothetical protein [Pseudoroseicyclus tamaricis]NDV00476.1 hypothetical protein [Pseudoroseicyclus tamaricis]